ncbi:MAG: hypothetical protein K5989_05025 [Lachnospiraceae bacterium]|nr:hypothetical protein [Lachnospiraceae bacterium]
MTILQKILLIAAGICYAVTLYSFFNSGVYIIILFFLLHSLCLLLFCYRCYMESTRDAKKIETYQQDIGMEMAEKDSLLKLLQERISVIRTGHMDLSRNFDELQLEKEKLEKRVAELEQEKQEHMDKEVATMMGEGAVMEGILPPLPEDAIPLGTVDIIALANRAKDVFRDVAQKAGLRITVSSALSMLPVRADENRLMILFKNIIDNSLKYMNRAGSLVITISTINDDIFVVLKDTGEGLPEAETRHIFELNYQGSNRMSGNGLGLAQARAIVEAYGGTIYARSTPGKGMGIYIQLPA